MQQGIELGSHKMHLQIAQEMLNLRTLVQQITSTTKLTPTQIQQLQEHPH